MLLKPLNSVPHKNMSFLGDDSKQFEYLSFEVKDFEKIYPTEVEIKKTSTEESEILKWDCPESGNWVLAGAIKKRETKNQPFRAYAESTYDHYIVMVKIDSEEVIQYAKPIAKEAVSKHFEVLKGKSKKSEPKAEHEDTPEAPIPKKKKSKKTPKAT